MMEGNKFNNSELNHGIENKKLLNDIMTLEARAEIIFSKMRSGAMSENYSCVLNLFDDLNFELNQCWNKYSYLMQNDDVRV